MPNTPTKEEMEMAEKAIFPLIYSVIAEQVAQLLHDYGQRRADEVVKAIEMRQQATGIAPYVAEQLGKEPTNSGPIAQARFDGYVVAKNDFFDAARRAANLNRE